MNETEEWVHEAKQLLRAFARSPRQESLDALRNHAHKMDLAQTLCHLGCDQVCSECSWGELGGFHLVETCRLVSFLAGLKETCEGARSPSSLKPDALALLSILDRPSGAN